MHNYEPSRLGEGREGKYVAICMSWRVEGVVEKINTLSPSTYKKNYTWLMAAVKKNQTANQELQTKSGQKVYSCKKM